MPNTSNAQLVQLSQKIYQEWLPKTVLVQSCDRSFEGELNLETREIDIPVYHDVSIHLTSLKERELKPAPIEFLKSSTKRVTIDKGRYSHWGVTTISKLVDKLSEENSETRKKLVNKWAIEAEKELALDIVFNSEIGTLIDIPTILGWSTTGFLKTDNVISVLDILKAHVTSANMTPDDFTLFASERFETILRDTKITFGSEPASDSFKKGFVAHANGIDVRKHEVAEITKRNATSKLVEAEYAIFKTRDGMQYVVPYKTTEQYEIQKSEILLGGTGYQTVEYYDYFNLYKNRVYKVKLGYIASATYPTRP